MRNIAEGAARIIEKAGEVVTYRAKLATSTYSATTGKLTATTADYTVRAAVRQYTAREISGLIGYGDREMRLRGINLGFTPKEGDLVKVGLQWFRVAGVDVRSAGDETALYILRITGQ